MNSFLDLAYRALVGLYPRRFRGEYGAEMVRLFRERGGALRGVGGSSYRRFLRRAFQDVLIESVAERTAIIARTVRRAPVRRTIQAPRRARESPIMTLLQDVRLALRMVRRQPGFALVVVLTIALGVGANTAIFSVVDGVLLKGLPFHQPRQLVTLEVLSHTGFNISLSIPNYVDFRDRNRSFEAFGASAGWTMTLTGRDAAQVVEGRLVLGGFFETLGVAPLHGRTFTAAETERGAEAVAVLGHRFWQREFHGETTAIGEVVTLDRVPHTIVGIMPASFGYPAATTDIYVPMGTQAQLPWTDRRSAFGARAIARLRDGVSYDAAQADVERFGREMVDEFGSIQGVPELRRFSDYYLAGTGTQVWILMGAVGFVLLIVIANVGNLMLVRGETRRGEVAVRTALGASRGMVMRHLLIEGLTLSVVGGILGLALAFVLVPSLVGFLGEDVPVVLADRVAVNGSVALFTLALSLGAGVLFGILPSFRLSRGSMVHELRTASRATDARGDRLRGVLVVTEVALATVLLIGAGLMLKTLVQLRNVDKGFEEAGVLTARVSRSYLDRDDWRTFYTSLETGAAALPGVESASVTLLIPLTDRSWEIRILPDGHPWVEENAPSVLFGLVGESYFTTLGVPILQGRAFNLGDRDDTDPVAIIDETMAERFWPGENPIGKRVTFEVTRTSTRENQVRVYRTVVGVARNVRHYEIDTPSRIEVYVPFTQPNSRWGMDLSIAMRTSVPPQTMAGPLRGLVKDLDRDAALRNVLPLADLVNAELSATRSVGTMLVLFGSAASLLAGLGIFGVISYTVARRTPEIGLRIALGAQPADVIRWVAGQGIRLSIVGVFLGLIGAAAIARVLAHYLYEVEPTEPAVYAAFAAVLVFVSAVATYLPARRAAHVDPMQALAEE